MNRLEALRILGLDEDATVDDIKTAYKETAQILHPDRFATNKKLQERATEQFKNLQEAYEYLTSGKGARGARASGSPSQRSSGYSAESQLEARLAGIAAARVQLVAQRDVVLDERRNGILMTVIGGIVALFTGRRPFGLFGVVAAIASAAAVWGIVSIVSAQRTLNNLDEHIQELNAEQRRIMGELDDL
ncbi:J domain-containing protein [Raoultibacter phocaeensis]|uniref:J domain-containing protein n=1 Tax=Raoultibacter phocaeensis TaxID=2479841 RepID=UPI001118BF4C|nr:J domain-containing protein [Raoultibacter phocaeensis]